MSQRFVVAQSGSVKHGVVFEVGRAHRDGSHDDLGKIVVSTNPENPIQFVTYPASLAVGIPSGTYRSMRRACIALERFAARMPVLSQESLEAVLDGCPEDVLSLSECISGSLGSGVQEHPAVEEGEEVVS